MYKTKDEVHADGYYIDVIERHNKIYFYVRNAKGQFIKLLNQEKCQSAMTY
jgi:hypothetical protein